MYTAGSPESSRHSIKTARYQELYRARREAGMLGRSGQATAGYRCLLEGLRRALAAAAAGEPWAADLAERYLLALDGYAGRHRLQPWQQAHARSDGGSGGRRAA